MNYTNITKREDISCTAAGMRDFDGAILLINSNSYYMIGAGSSILKNYIIEHFEMCVMDAYLFPVSKYMVKKVNTGTVSHTVQYVCKTMYENNIGCLVLTKRTTSGLVPVGIVTERDIVKIIGSTDLFIGQAAIREFMSSPVVTVSTNTTLSAAIDIMNAKKIRRLPITSKNKDGTEKLLGIISNRDILKAIGEINHIPDFLEMCS